MFTKQHYKAIAKIVSDAESIDSSDYLYRNNVIQALVRMFKTDNPRFNKDTFIIACNEKTVYMLSIS